MLTEQIKEMRSQRMNIVAEVITVRKNCDDRAAHSTKFEAKIKDDFEREARRNDVEHRGIPLPQNSDEAALRDIILTLAAYIKVVVTHEHIVFVREISFKVNQRRESIVLLRFRDQAIRRSYMSAFFSMKKITLRVLGHDLDKRITISDSYTKTNSEIRIKVVQLKVNDEIEGFSARDELIYITVFGDRRRHCIISLEDLATVLNKPLTELSGSMKEMTIINRTNQPMDQ